MQNDHLTDSERQHYERSIGKLSQASSLSKLFLFIIAGIAVAVLILSIQANNRAKQEAAAAQERNRVVLQQIKDATDSVNRHLDCITIFFSRTDRQDLTIKDVDKCVLQRDSNPADTFIPKEITDKQTKDSTAPQTNGSGADSKKSTTPQQPEEPSNPPEEHPPVRVLGIPVCVPFTGVCARS
jgi:hypothetical protein